MAKTNHQIMQAMRDAADLRHPDRAMRVLLECGHLRLETWRNCGMGIGAYTRCKICPNAPTRQIMSQEETGVLHDSWLQDTPSGTLPAQEQGSGSMIDAVAEVLDQHLFHETASAVLYICFCEAWTAASGEHDVARDEHRHHVAAQVVQRLSQPY